MHVSENALAQLETTRRRACTNTACGGDTRRGVGAPRARAGADDGRCRRADASSRSRRGDMRGKRERRQVSSPTTSRPADGEHVRGTSRARREKVSRRPWVSIYRTHALRKSRLKIPAPFFAVNDTSALELHTLDPRVIALAPTPSRCSRESSPHPPRASTRSPPRQHSPFSRPFSPPTTARASFSSRAPPTRLFARAPPPRRSRPPPPSRETRSPQSRPPIHPIPTHRLHARPDDVVRHQRASSIPDVPQRPHRRRAPPPRPRQKPIPRPRQTLERSRASVRDDGRGEIRHVQTRRARRHRQERGAARAAPA